MTTQNQTADREAIEAVEQYKQTEEKVEISRDALNELGATRDNRVSKWERDNLPVKRAVYRRDDGTWITVETHTNQQGEKRTLHYLTHIGTIDIEHADLDLEAARDIIDNDPHWNADTEQALEAIEREQHDIGMWWIDGLVEGSIGIVGNDDFWYIVMPTMSPEYHLAPELDPGEAETFREAVGATHPMLHDYPSYYRGSCQVEYVVEPEYYPTDKDVDELIN